MCPVEPSPRTSVRSARLRDVDAVVHVGEQSWAATYTSIAGAEYVRAGLARWWTRDGTHAAIAAGEVLVAEQDGRVVAMLARSVEGDVLDVWKLYALPGAQRTGVGTVLLCTAVERHRRDVRIVRLAHKDGNVVARAFYDKHGFVETHRTPDDLGGPDNVWMERRLRL